MKRLTVAIAFLFTVIVSAAAFGWTHGQGIVQGFSGALQGPGGYLTGFDIDNSGNIIARLDTYGAWVWDQNASYCGNTYPGGTQYPQPPSGCWRQTVTMATMPNGTTQKSGLYGLYGAYEVAISRQNYQKLYMLYGADGCLYTSANYGGSWAKAAGFTCLPSNTNPNAGNVRNINRRMAVDPANDAVLIFSTANGGGQYYTTNTGTTVTSISTSSIAAPTINIGVLFAFDPSSTVSGGQTQGVWACSWGNGCYQSTTGVSGSWTLSTATGMPLNAMTLKVDQIGNVWLIASTTANPNSGGSLYVLPKAAPTAWIKVTAAQLTGNGTMTVAIDPNPAFNTNCNAGSNCLHVVATGSGIQNVIYSTAVDATNPNAATWVVSAIFGRCTHNPPGGTQQGNACAYDVPWLNFTGMESMDAGAIEFNAAQSSGVQSNSVLYASTGTGFWRYPNIYGLGTGANNETGPSPFHTQWFSYSAKIQQLVVNWVTAPWFTGSSVLTANWDRVELAVNPNGTKYPSVQGLNRAQISGCNITKGTALDWASSNPQFVVGFSGADCRQFGSSNDGGITFPTTIDNTTLPPGCPSNCPDLTLGSIVASSPLVWLAYWYHAGASFALSGLYCSTNAGTSAWTGVNVVAGGNNIPATDSGWYSGTTSNYPLAADRVAFDTGTVSANGNGTLYAVNRGTTTAFGGIYVSYNSCSSWNVVQLGFFNSSGHASAGQIRAVPGVAYDIFYSQGDSLASMPYATYTPIADQVFEECIGTGGPPPTTWTCSATQANGKPILEVSAFGFGAPKPGGATFPTIYIFGFVWNPTAGTNGVSCVSGGCYQWGYYRSIDHGVTWTLLGCTPGSWTIACAYPENFDHVTSLDGDANTYGLFYYGRTGSGVGQGYFPN